MKNTFIKSLLFISFIAAAGCNKQLETTPTQSIDQAEALTSSDDVKVALVGAYHDFGAADFYGGRTFLESDLLADANEMNWSGTYQQLTQIKNKTIPVDNSFVANMWLAGYRAINDVNNVLSALSVVNKADTSRVSGEAKFIRGASYFQLVRRFAKAWNDGDPNSNPGVPIVLTPTRTITEESKVSRATVAQVYAQVISDLQAAEASLPLKNTFFADQSAAAAMLARVYLQQGNYAEAAKAADRAISKAIAYIRTESGGNYLPARLVDNYADAFAGSNTSEDIFAIQVTPTAGTQGFNEFYSASQRGDVQITDTHLGLYEPGDTRKQLFYDDAGSTFTGKFEEVYGNVHIIRLAEMYLTRAEGNFLANTAVGAPPVDDINLIRKRAGLPAYTAGELTIENIRKERKLELAFEGFNLDDIKRTKGNVGNLQWNSPKLVFPIPQREIRANPNLTQNEGY